MSDEIVIARELAAKRDQKVKPHLQQYAPVWIIEEHFLLEEEAIQFQALFMHPTAGLDGKPAWVNRRYRYDGFNDVLYHKGQVMLEEDDALDLTEAEPYVDALASDTPNAYGG